VNRPHSPALNITPRGVQRQASTAESGMDQLGGVSAALKTVGIGDAPPPLPESRSVRQLTELGARLTSSIFCYSNHRSLISLPITLISAFVS
jgi:hypothetical protein